MDDDTPRNLGYMMPAEWEEHEATWLSWPKNPDTFPSDIMGSVESTYCAMVSALKKHEKVKILVDNEAMEEHVRQILSENGSDDKGVLFFLIKSADVWMRDYGPIGLVNRHEGKLSLVKWTFNAWGEKYDDLLYDDKTGHEVAQAIGGRIFFPDMVLEGGSIDVNGEGSLMTTEQCLLNRNRNPDLTKAQIERRLSDYLGVSNIIWLGEGIEGDDTDGHIDDFARFVSSETVLCAATSDPADKNSRTLKKNLQLLEKATDKHGEPLEVLTLPTPRPLSIPERRLPASYANFYVANRSVLFPVFGDKYDDTAAGIVQECFPERNVVPIPALDLVYGYGGIHCVTQQQPKAQLFRMQRKTQKFGVNEL